MAAHESIEMFTALMLVLYIAFAYHHIPQPLVDALGTVPGKVVAGMIVFVSAFLLHPSVTLLLVLAVLMSVPGIELYENKDSHTKAPGKNIQPRKAPKVDTESKLRKSAMSKPAVAKPSGAKPAPMPDKNTEHFVNPFGVY